MNKLYSQAFKRSLDILKIQRISTTNVAQVLQQNNIAPTTNAIFHRMNRQDLKGAVKVPCPIQKQINAQFRIENEQQKEIIRISKTLRANFSIEQPKICNKCPHKNNCSEFSKPGNQSTNNAIADLLVFMQSSVDQGFLKERQGYDLYRSEYSGFKACDSLITVLIDMKKGAQQTKQYERLRQNHLNEQNEVKMIMDETKKLETIYMFESVKGVRISVESQRSQQNDGEGEQAQEESIKNEAEFERQMSKNSFKGNSQINNNQNRGMEKYEYKGNAMQKKLNRNNEVYRNPIFFRKSESSKKSMAQIKEEYE